LDPAATFGGWGRTFFWLSNIGQRGLGGFSSDRQALHEKETWRFERGRGITSWGKVSLGTPNFPTRAEREWFLTNPITEAKKKKPTAGRRERESVRRKHLKKTT